MKNTKNCWFTLVNNENIQTSTSVLGGFDVVVGDCSRYNTNIVVGQCLVYVATSTVVSEHLAK